MSKRNSILSNPPTSKDLREFLEHVKNIQDHWFRKTDEPFGPWFRGHQNAHWPLLPKLYRDYGGRQRRKAQRIEDEIREEFIVRAPALSDVRPAGADNWEWYFLMQHFGAPTRLLDWTQGALIALYFAVKDNPGIYDAAVWALDPYDLNKQVLGSDEVIPPSTDVNSHSRRMLKRWLPDRFPKKPVALPNDPIAIYPTHIARRISSQRSGFTIHGRDEGGLDRLARIKNGHLRKIVIPRFMVRSIREDLETCGIDEATIFPDLDGLGRCLSRWWRQEHHEPPHKYAYTRLGPSRVDDGGVGVFAIRNVKKGTPLFRGDNEEMLSVRKNRFANAPRAIRRLYDDFAIINEKEERYLCPPSFNRLTVSWYINEPKRGERPNVCCNADYDFSALRDIKAGEELTVLYSTYSDLPVYRRTRKKVETA